MEYKRPQWQIQEDSFEEPPTKSASTLSVDSRNKNPEVDQIFIKLIWSSNDFGWSFVEAFGKSGGILTIWDESKVALLEFLKRWYCLSVKIMAQCKNIVGWQMCTEQHIIENIDSFGLRSYPYLIFAWSLDALEETSILQDGFMKDFLLEESQEVWENLIRSLKKPGY